MKKSIIIYCLLFALLTFSLISSCTKGYIPEDIAPITPPSATDSITYQSHIAQVVSTHCLSCHSGTNPQGNLQLESYNQVRQATETGTLIQRINDAADPMPTSGLMSAENRALFDQWVQNGFPEN